MKYHILINTSFKNENSNVLVMDNVLDKGLNIIKDDLNLSDNDVNEIKQCINNQTPIKPNLKVEYVTLDDEDLAIPCYDTIVLAFVNNEPYKWFGNYCRYVMRLWGEDLDAQSASDVEELGEESHYCPYYEDDIRIKDGSTINIKTVCVKTQIFD